jgi:CO/xanthine dehydrogenase Mo-binding subunit
MDVTTYTVVGQPVTREDGPEKVSGKTCYAGDLRLPGMLWGKVLRSPFPHARIVRIDPSGALQLPGVHAVLTGHDVAGRLVGRTLRDVPLLAQEKVRFVGEKVDVVAADDVDTADEALTRIEVEYAELPAVFDPVEAMQPGAPVVHDGAPAY